MRKVLLAALLLLLPLLSVPTATASPVVGTATYTLGDTAYELPSTDVKAELTAVVHYPKNLSKKYPVVLMSHGLWISCADPKAWAEEDYEKLSAWPCAAGTPAIPSYRGYDYLAKTLAAQGMIVISIGANGTLPLMGEEQDAARAALINKHLAMWQQLSSTRRRTAGRQGARPRQAGRLPRSRRPDERWAARALARWAGHALPGGTSEGLARRGEDQGCGAAGSCGALLP